MPDASLADSRIIEAVPSLLALFIEPRYLRVLTAVTNVPQQAISIGEGVSPQPRCCYTSLVVSSGHWSLKQESRQVALLHAQVLSVRPLPSVDPYEVKARNTSLGSNFPAITPRQLFLFQSFKVNYPITRTSPCLTCILFASHWSFRSDITVIPGLSLDGSLLHDKMVFGGLKVDDKVVIENPLSACP